MASLRSRLPRVPRRWTLLAEDDLRDPFVRFSLVAVVIVAAAARAWPGAFSRVALLWSAPFFLAIAAQRLGALRVEPGAAPWVAQSDRAGTLGFYFAVLGGQMLTLGMLAIASLVALGLGLPADTSDPAVTAYYATFLGGALLAFAGGALCPRYKVLGWAAPVLPLAGFYALSALAPHYFAAPGLAARLLFGWGALAVVVSMISFRRRLGV